MEKIHPNHTIVCASKDYKLCLKLFICFSSEKKQHRMIATKATASRFKRTKMIERMNEPFLLPKCVSSPNNDPVTHKNAGDLFVHFTVLNFLSLFLSIVCFGCAFPVRYVDLWNRRAIPAAHCTNNHH